MKSTNIQDYIVKSNQVPWKLLREEGVDTRGLWVKSLRYDEEQNRPPTFFLRFEPGSSYPHHNHPAGEELLVLEGSCEIEGATLVAGDYLYTPPGFKHSVKTAVGCTLLLIVPKEVEIQ